jgi:hypothetical protein
VIGECESIVSDAYSVTVVRVSLIGVRYLLTCSDKGDGWHITIEPLETGKE